MFHCLTELNSQMDALESVRNVYLHGKVCRVATGSNLMWPNTVFLYLCVIYRYFQTTGSWAAKIGKVQVQLKKIVS